MSDKDKMSTLMVLAFDNETGALEMREDLKRMQKEHIVELEDAAVVIRKPDGKVKVKQAVSLVGKGALGGAFWGMLIGLLFFMPWLGLAVGALSGAFVSSLADVGVDDGFIKRVGSTIEPGHSAIFLLIREATPDKLLEELKKYDCQVLHTSLSSRDEEKLRAAFGASDD
jgi:uncharacterized membrane protein